MRSSRPWARTSSRSPKIPETPYAGMPAARKYFPSVAPVAILQESLSAILHHHERVDGTGYPSRLAGSKIPFVARVVAVADVWDALTSDRSYRPGWPPADDGEIPSRARASAGSGKHARGRAPQRHIVPEFDSILHTPPPPLLNAMVAWNPGGYQSCVHARRVSRRSVRAGLVAAPRQRCARA